MTTKPIATLRGALTDIHRQLDETLGRSTSNAYSVISTALLATQNAAALEARPGPTDTEMLDWLLPVVSGAESPEINRRTIALMGALMLGKEGRAAVAAAMEGAP